jgi:hypothetical protein
LSNDFDYTEKFQNILLQKYNMELFTSGLTGFEGFRFIDGQTVRIPSLTLKGFKNHNRSGGFNRQDIACNQKEFKLRHDRDVEFFVDCVDTDETDNELIALNITDQFERDNAIPETDCYRISEIYNQYVGFGGIIDNTELTEVNILEIIDSMMMTMDENQAPVNGRILYITPSAYRLLKSAGCIQRTIELNTSEGNWDTSITMLDGIKIVVVPSTRMMTKYDFTDGVAIAADAKQIHMILIYPDSVIAVNKHSHIKLWPEGTHTMGDGYLYQNRQYMDLFVIPDKINGIAICVQS